MTINPQALLRGISSPRAESPPRDCRRGAAVRDPAVGPLDRCAGALHGAMGVAHALPAQATGNVQSLPRNAPILEAFRG
jgi:hypothetical protein